MNKSYFKLLLLPVALMFAILAGCGNLSQVSEPVNNGQGTALLKITAAAGMPFQKLAKKASLTISAGDMLTMTKSLTITDSSVEGTITGIPAGKNRLFAVVVYDSLDTLQYKGSASANVIADSTVKVSINVIRIVGNVTVDGNIFETQDSVTDINGNVYHTVTIGKQVWMVENLKTTRYNDGTGIPLITDNSAWTALTTPGFCYYNNDSISYKATYGALYNWYAVNTGKLAPTGWHVPTDSDWSVLTTVLGGTSAAGGKLKEVGTIHWNAPNSGATNESGFTALAGGSRDYVGPFANIGHDANWWAYSAGVTVNAGSYTIFCDSTFLKRYGKTISVGDYGMSVRCVKN